MKSSRVRKGGAFGRDFGRCFLAGLAGEAGAAREDSKKKSRRVCFMGLAGICYQKVGVFLNGEG